MSTPCTCLVPYSTTLFFIALNHLCLIEISRQIADVVVSKNNEEGA
jgi:hypothetical protein